MIRFAAQTFKAAIIFYKNLFIKFGNFNNDL